jgi:hypothetical protein
LNYGLERVWTIGYIKGSNRQVHLILTVTCLCIQFVHVFTKLFLELHLELYRGIGAMF